MIRRLVSVQTRFGFQYISPLAHHYHYLTMFRQSHNEQDAATMLLKAYVMPKPANTILMLCDIQDKFGTYIPNIKRIVASSTMLMKTAHQLNIPVIGTEQYPKVFGKTVTELSNDKNKIFEKTLFSMCCESVNKYLIELNKRKTDKGVKLPEIKNIILTGMEAHICVTQTSLDLLKKGYNVHLCVDAIGSQRELDKTVAVRRLELAGVTVTTSESVVFQLLRDAKHPQFKPVQGFVKQHIADIKSIESEKTSTKTNSETEQKDDN